MKSKPVGWFVKGGLFWLPFLLTGIIVKIFANITHPLWSTILPWDIPVLLSGFITLGFFVATGALLDVVPVGRFFAVVSRFIISRVPSGKLFSRRQEMSRELAGYQGALFPIYDGVWIIGAVTGVQKMEYVGKSGDVVSGVFPKELYKGYSPSAPVPWSGFPIIFAAKNRVILLNLSLREIWNITTSFGMSSPNVIKYLLGHTANDVWDNEREQ